MGISTSNDQICSFGTLGFAVCDAVEFNIIGYITNNHVAAADPNGCPNGAPQWTRQFHRALGDAGCATTAEVGRLDTFMPISFTGTNEMDAAFVRSSDMTPEILDIGTPSGSVRNPDSLLNASVIKSGRSTGLTTGTVTTINATVSVSYGTLCGVATFIGQIFVGPGDFSGPGDSGSTVLVNDGSNDPVGLLFARGAETIVSPLGPVLERLFCRLAANCPPRFNRATFVAQSVPAVMSAGQFYDVSITMRNSGVTTWRTVDGYKLGSQNPRDNTFWGTNRLNLPSDVPPDSDVTFFFGVTAPIVPGVYGFQWRMLQELSDWFGDFTSNVFVTVN